MQLRLLIALTLLLFTLAKPSFAFESEDQAYGYADTIEFKPTQNNRSLELDANRIQKFEAALDTLGIPKEDAPDFSNFIHANEVNEFEVRKNMPFIDPDKGIARYLSFSKGTLQLFRDFFRSITNLDYLEFETSLSANNPSIDSLNLIQRLKSVATQVRARNNLPLLGLKILIDPGHMGGNDWDHHTGKFVEFGGKKVSEGDLTLWTSLLTAKKLEDLGALVVVTRERQMSVSNQNPETFDITPHVNNYFYNSLDGWMAPYLEQPIDTIRKTIRNASEVGKAYTDTQRMQYFILGEDLEARSKMIDSFQPDITIDIHYDATKTDQIQSKTQSLEAFIPGAFLKAETGARKTKALALKHLLEVRRWNQTVDLADEVTSAMSKSLGIPRLDSPQAFTGIRVRDGVYTRNLYIARRAMSGLLIYLECLHYDHVQEHSRLANLDRSATYHQTEFKYPSRVDEVVSGIESGILNYFKNAKF
jgi:N-acetylmuramoyl-L-alanine amidase